MSQSDPDSGVDDSTLGMNAGWVEILRENYRVNPKSVDPAWAKYFAEDESTNGSPPAGSTALPASPLSDVTTPASTANPTPHTDGEGSAVTPPTVAPAFPGVRQEPPEGAAVPYDLSVWAVPAPSADRSLETALPSRSYDRDEDLRLLGVRDSDPVEIRKQANSIRMIHAFRSRGHRIAKTDPLGMRAHYFPDLDPERYGFAEEDTDRKFMVGDLPGESTQTLRQILNFLRSTYTRSIGVEFTHIQDPDRKAWLIERIESDLNETVFSREEKLHILERLSSAELFEHFVHKRFIGQKRFSLEGAESLIPLLDSLVEDGPARGTEQYVIGMAHRGRLNVLCNILGKSKASIFQEFEDQPNLKLPFGSGDVKYHKGFSSDRTTQSGARVHLTLTSNPSHLEAVNPVVVGRTRAKQARLDDISGDRAVAVMIHGDAAFAGQGIVAETLNLSQIKGYTTGGSIHIVIDNQIGFTTTPSEARSSLYATDVAKMIQIPVFHVNGDDPEAVVHVTRLAMDYRKRFHSDVVINLVCYRRHGHNEGDEPMFTQPRLYRKIKAQTPVRLLYTQKLIDEQTLTEVDATTMAKDLEEKLDAALESIKTSPPGPDESYEPRGPWRGFSRTRPKERVQTSVSQEALVELAHQTTAVPSDFNLHPKLRAMYDKRMAHLEAGHMLDWAFGEMVAYASLLAEGFSVRISGQDCSRGTFSHRHAVVTDQTSGEEYTPLAEIEGCRSRFEVYDSLLSEVAVLGYEYGYSVADPQTLVIWEAQFADFVNGAQVIIDQFISCAHVKWGRMSGLVMFLPHGYEGQGPEHSSGRIERFLQLCAEQNLQITNLTTPAQMFHLLRRQMLRNFRAPLIVFTPKSLLRHPRATSHVTDFTKDRFHLVLDDELTACDADPVQRVLFCTGKVYYDLLAYRNKRSAERTAHGLKLEEDVAIVRIEQLYPVPRSSLADVIARYRNAKLFYWVQEEPENNGAWNFLRPRLQRLLPEPLRLQYSGRTASASPAVGSNRLHHEQQKALVEKAFAGLPTYRPSRIY